MVDPTRTAPDDARPPDRWTVLYDGECGFCRKAVERLERLDREKVLRTLPYQDPEARERFSWIPEEDLEEALHVVSPQGEAWAGARAVERLLERLPGSGLPGLLFKLPMGRNVADKIYRWIARHRHDLGCGEHCRTD